ncbi:dnaJ homolog subfamily C member 5-like [Varroa jacobsoni]|uniref:J domain-containing protein n=1 Tax=Varroa destructor TaxID=109461 RepID=A0A7M7KNV6_VARDE|nr:dnaJ homolog subfamily C member 5-like [Varroa destructor]XP_022703830.1 dnaJ homolog subfamily C member 5-like [Varroa jacobsoni]
MTKGPESTCQSLVWKNGPRAFNDEHSLSTQGGTCLYDILGITKKATNTEIRKAYRRLALAYHPDRNKEADAAKKFRRVQYAQKILLDPNKRNIYDKFGSKGIKLADRVGEKNVPFMLYLDTFWGRCLAGFLFVITGCGCCCLCCGCCFCCECCCKCCCNRCCGVFARNESQYCSCRADDRFMDQTPEVVDFQPNARTGGENTAAGGVKEVHSNDRRVDSQGDGSNAGNQDDVHSTTASNQNRQK